jgi:hypothetical protein
MTSSSGFGLNGIVYLQSYSDLADTHWLGITCVLCGWVQSISIPTALAPGQPSARCSAG